MASVIDHFGLTLICWRDKGGCNAFHWTHIHVSLGADYHNARPKCDGGSAGFLEPSPGMVKFRDELYRRFPKLHAPGGGDGILDCRPVDGTTSWSNHAYGTAIDVTTDGSDSTLIDYLNKVYAWLNGPWKDEEEDDLTPTQDHELNRVWNSLAKEADAYDIKRPANPDADTGDDKDPKAHKGWVDAVLAERVKRAAALAADVAKIKAKLGA